MSRAGNMSLLLLGFILGCMIDSGESDTRQNLYIFNYYGNSNVGSSIRVRYTSESDSVWVQCKNWPKSLATNLDFRDRIWYQVSEINIENCNLPKDNDLGTYVKQLILRPNISSLKFRSRKNLAKSFTPTTLSSFKNVKILDLSMNKLFNVLDYLKNFDNLTDLNLGFNNINEIDGKSLNFPNLKKLILQGNPLKLIDASSFINLPKLQHLDISKSKIIQIQSQSFNNLFSLRVLMLNINNLTSLPLNIFNQSKNLTELDLSSNNISRQTLPSDLLKNNQKLEIVRFNKNPNLQTIPDNFFANLSNLQRLSLNENGLVDLPVNLLSGNKNLHLVEMMHNSLTTLPELIFKDCKNLTTIRLSSNQIEHLPDGIFSTLNNLGFLDLEHNRITQISENLVKGLPIVGLIMSDNKISRIHENAFQGINSFKFVDLSQNQIHFNESLSMSPFHFSSKTIEELNLSGNKITKIYKDWLIAPKLQRLMLGYNYITSLSYDDLVFSSPDIRLHLNDNRIQKIDFSGLKITSIENVTRSNVYVDIKNNPIVCNCSIYDFVQYLQKETDEGVYILGKSKILCESPVELNKLPLKNLDFDHMECTKKN